MEPAQPVNVSPPLSPKQLKEQQAEAERVQEVNLLLTNLFEREQQTIKAIIGCLYDVGTVNLINQRVGIRPLRPLVRPLFRASKPLLIPFGYRWVSRKCPALVTRWLQRKVKAVTSKRPPVAPLQPPPVSTTDAKQIEAVQPLLYQGEIRRLRSQVRWTTAALAGVSVTLAVTLTKPDIKSVEPVWQSSSSNALSVERR